MRRKDKAINKKAAIEAIIHKSLVCRLGLSYNNTPYIVPMCFGYKNDILYFHSASEGKKIDIIKKNQNVCFQFDTNIEIKKAEDACHWGMKYQSVIGFGKADFINDFQEKKKAMHIIMSQYSDQAFQFPDSILKGTSFIKVLIESMTGKQSGF